MIRAVRTCGSSSHSSRLERFSTLRSIEATGLPQLELAARWRPGPFWIGGAADLLAVSEFLELWEGGACLPDEPTFDGFIVDREALWAAYDNELPRLPYTTEYEPYDDETTTLAVEVMKSTTEAMTFGPSEHVRSTLHSVTRAELPDPWTGEVRDVIASMRGSFEIVDLWGRHVVAEYNAQNCMAAGCDNCRGLSAAVNGWYAEDDEI
jgi:hypothetical protein